jgi:hypothetical protein
MTTPKTPKILKLVGKIATECPACQRDTNHGVIFLYRRIKEGKKLLVTPDHISKYQDFMIVQCAGCDTVSFLDRTYDKTGKSFDYQYPEPDWYVNEELFLPDEEFDQLPKMIRDLYLEVQDAFEAESKILAGIGLRTLIEAVCIQQSVSGKVLQDKIQSLHRQGAVSSAELPILHKLRTIGNVSAHEIKGIPFSVLKHAITVVNHLFRSVYILPKVNKKIKI